MGITCSQPRNPKKFHDYEIHSLKLIYKDLAQRSNGQLQKDAFCEFFKIIGLWGEKIFNQFKRAVPTQVTEEEFISNLGNFIKDHSFYPLFNFTGNGIQKSDFLQMLYNVPKGHINQILEDQLFLEEEKIIEAYARRPKKNSFEQQSLQIIRRKSEIPDLRASSRQPISIQSQCSIHRNDQMFQGSINGVPQNGCVINLTFQVNGQQQEMTINKNLLTKRYVDNIYKSKQDQSLSKVEFETFLQKHPKLADIVYQGFNYEIWGVENNIPIFKGLPKDYEGSLFIYSRKTKHFKQRYCVLYKNFLFEFKRQTDIKQSRIICMKGLCVIEKIDEENQKYGFVIEHVEKNYKAREYQCQDLKSHSEWIDGLKAYYNGEIHKKYLIQDNLGDGKYSQVFKCKNKSTSNEYALKIIDKTNLHQQEKDLIGHETQIMTLLNHSCILKLIETYENRTHIYIVTELLKDGDLFDFVKIRNYLSQSEAALILRHLIDAVEYMHKVGIVHRDIKAENIMIILKGNQICSVKLIDFGYATYLDSITDNILCGTPGYMAPEQLIQQQVTFKSDNFALGVILYYMLSGFLPFYASTAEETIMNCIDGKYEIEDEFWQCVDTDAKDLIQQLLQRKVEDRISLEDAKKHRWLRRN